MKKMICTLLLSALTPLFALQNMDDSVSDGIIKEYELSGEKWKEWNAVRENWMRNDYRACLKKFRLKMSCAGCTYIYIKAVISIDKEGRMKSYRKTDENVCGGKILPAVEKCFMKPLEEKTFPDQLKDAEFETMLGTGLMC